MFLIDNKPLSIQELIAFAEQTKLYLANTDGKNTVVSEQQPGQEPLPINLVMFYSMSY